MAEQERTAGAIAAADILMCGKEKIHTEYGFKTAEGVADLIDNKTAAPELLAACERDAELASVAISMTPTGDARNRLTEINILRLAAIAKATP